MSREEAAIIVAVVSIAFGGANCFYGYRVFKVLLGILGFFLGATVAGNIAFAVTEGNRIVAIIAGFVGGAIAASLIVYLYFGGLFLVGAGFGALLAGLLFASAGSEPHPAAMIALAIVGGVIAVMYQKLMIVVSTSFGGAWSVVVGVSVLAGGRIDPAEALVHPENLLGDTRHYYLMLLCWLVLGAAGLFVQHRYTAWEPGEALMPSTRRRRPVPERPAGMENAGARSEAETKQ